MKKFDYNKLTGIVITRDDFEYEESRLSWNRAIQKYPLVFVYCTEKEDIINAINWARENEVEIRVRSGCHNYEGYSTGNDVLVIDVSKMNNIHIDEEDNKVTINAGVRNRELYEATGKLGYPFPGGGCPTVGVIGFVLGAGWGYSSRLFGLACDSLVEVELIDYKGDIIIANEAENKDLFWACRGGGGGNFGVVTSMTFNLPSKIKMATLISIEYPHIDIEKNIDLIETLQNTYKTLDRRMNLKTGIYNSKEKGRGVRITGLFYGNKEEANKALEPLRNVTSRVNFDLDYITVLDANREIQDSHPDYEKYKSTGRFVCRDYTRDEIRELIKLLEDRPEGSVYAALSFYGLGGAVCDIDKDATAFYYRDAKFIMGLQSVWEEDKYAPINREWVKEQFKYMKEMTTGSFVNFPIAELPNYEDEYYGNHAEKLREVKAKYDPQNIFEFPQGITVDNKNI
ncbi:FAD-binding oxidoreductase [Clostridium sardiniense]|uniref:FAD-binding oxidoreductase n=1 Tax=Clostridium sardiniense TaxID=29369 RepID=UPI003D3325F8